MPTLRAPRKGSLQYWPRKRADKFLPSVNWEAINSTSNQSKNLKGFIVYKAGMKTAFVKDSTLNSMTLGKQIAVPITIIECPPMKILSVRFYKHGIVAKEILAPAIEKELKRKIKLPKKNIDSIDSIDASKYDDVRVVCYSNVKKTNIKKTPDIAEIAVVGQNIAEKLKVIKEKLGKEIFISEIFEKGKLADFRGLTKGKGLQGPVKRFGLALKHHKTEKGRRRPGSLGPWHPARVTFRAPISGQIGLFTRVITNSKIISIKKSTGEDELKNIKNYGDVKTDYLVIRGSVQGPSKRALIATSASRETKKQSKKNLELIRIAA